MPIYNYRAKRKDGSEVFGVESAKDEEELSKILSAKNLTLISVREEEEEKKPSKKGWNLNIKIGGKVKLTDKMMFTRHLAVMIASGFPFDRSLDVLEHQAQNSTFKEVIGKIREDVIHGVSFSEALKKHPKVFDELYVNMVRVGEETGKLKESLDILATQMKKDHDIRGKVRGALMYPVILVCLMILIGIIMMIFVLPKFSQTFKDLNVPLPATTQFIFSIGDLMAKYFYLIPVVLFLIIFTFLRIKKTKKGKDILDKIYLKMPIFGPIIKKMNIARTARILSSLIKSGVPIVTSLKILSETLTNNVYKEVIAEASRKIQKGKTLKECLEKYENIFSYLLIQMIEVGEETGSLGEVLTDLAEFYEGEVDTTTKNLSTIIEPLMMVLIGGAVGVFAISILQPMYSIMSAIK